MTRRNTNLKAIQSKEGSMQRLELRTDVKINIVLASLLKVPTKDVWITSSHKVMISINRHVAEH